MLDSLLLLEEGIDFVRPDVRRGKRLVEGVVHDAHVAPERGPERGRAPLDREVGVVRVREAQRLRGEVHVEEGLLRERGRVARGGERGAHVREDARAGAEEHDAGVEGDAEAARAGEHVGHGGEAVREREELVEAGAHERVGVEVDEAAHAERVERPDVELGVLVAEVGGGARAAARGRDVGDGVGRPAGGGGEAEGAGGDAGGEVDEDEAGGDVGAVEGVGEGDDGGGVRVGVERRDDGAIARGVGCGRWHGQRGRRVEHGEIVPSTARGGCGGRRTGREVLTNSGSYQGVLGERGSA